MSKKYWRERAKDISTCKNCHKEIFQLDTAYESDKWFHFHNEYSKCERPPPPLPIYGPPAPRAEPHDQEDLPLER